MVHFKEVTVNSLLLDTSIRQTPCLNELLELVPLLVLLFDSL